MPFSFMETSFVVSLGITFILLLLLIYHFKQRLSIAESKQDTMFEIINNLAQEVNNVRAQMALSFANRPSTPYPHDVIHPDSVNIREQFQKIIENKEDDEEDSSDSEYETDSDEDSDDEERIIVSDEENDDNISVEEIRPNEDTTATDVDVDILENIEYTKYDIETVDNEQNDGSKDVKIEKPDFSKMNLGALKSYIVQQGWVEDASKMKKAQILSLIEEHQAQQ